MGRYDFLSPGAAAGGSLVDTLAKHREEARQRLLDEITQKDSETRRQAAEQQMRASQESIRASEQERELRQIEEAAKSLDYGQQVTDPDTLALFKKYNRVGKNPNPKPSVSTDTDFGNGEVITEGTLPAEPDPNENYYLGDEAQRKRERIKGIAGDFHPGSPMSSILESDTPFMQQAAAISALFEQPMPASAMQPQSQYFTVAPNGTTRGVVIGGKKQYAPPGDRAAINLPQELRVPLIPFVDDEAGEDETNIYWGNTQRGNISPATRGEGVPPHLRRAGTGNPRPPVQKPLVTDAVVKQINALRTEALRPGAPRTARAKYADYVMGVAANTVTLDRSINQEVLRIVGEQGQFDANGNPLNDERSAHEIAAEYAKQPDAKPEEIAQFEQLLLLVRGF